MASGKKSREARRAAAAKPPPVQSKGGARTRQASPKVLGGIAAVVGIVIVAVVLVVVLTGGKKSAVPKDVPAVGSVANGLPGSAEVEALYKGIPQKNLVLGSAFAPVTMVEYIDLQCPICQEFETTVMPDIIPKYVRTGKVKVDVRPWAFIGPDSFRGQAAMLAAGMQNKAFNYSSILYDNQGTENTGWLDDNMVVQAAASIPGLEGPAAARRPQVRLREEGGRRPSPPRPRPSRCRARRRSSSARPARRARRSSCRAAATRSR